MDRSQRAIVVVAFVVAVAAAGCDTGESSTQRPETSAAQTDPTLACCGEETTAVDEGPDQEFDVVITTAVDGDEETRSEPVSSDVAVVVTEPNLDGVMPDVLCMDLQEAQDLIQTRGVFYSRSEDASGDGRRQIVDSNWIVIAQRPAAGESIGEGDAVLSVLKDAEVTECIPGVGGS